MFLNGCTLRCRDPNADVPGPVQGQDDVRGGADELQCCHQNLLRSVQRRRYVYVPVSQIPQTTSDQKSVVDPGFPKKGANPRGGDNLLFGIVFAENCMKMKLDLGEGTPPLSQCRFANASSH